MENLPKYYKGRRGQREGDAHLGPAAGGGGVPLRGVEPARVRGRMRAGLAGEGRLNRLVHVSGGLLSFTSERK